VRAKKEVAQVKIFKHVHQMLQTIVTIFLINSPYH